MLNGLRRSLSDVEFVRKSARFLLVMGDSVRPIVQKPIVSRFIGTRLNDCVLDAGCGRGLYTRVLARRAKRVIAFDYSPAHVQALSRRLADKPHVSLFVGSADAVPLPAAQFDLVTHCEVLEHIPDDRKVLSEIHRVLKPGGRLILSVPVPPAPIDDKEHVREGYTFEQISGLLDESGFQIIQHQFCLFNLSKRLIKFEAWWRQKLRVPIPSLILLPLFWERLSPPTPNGSNLPYDVVIEAKKSLKPQAENRSVSPLPV
jgi:SAM-dependent methyltransferase